MSMLHQMAAGTNIKYKSKSTIPFLIKQTKWYHRPANRKAALAALYEVRTMRERLSAATIECSEWRLKVGGAAYSAQGTHFMAVVEEGIRNRIGPYIHLTDEDFYANTGAT